MKALKVSKFKGMKPGTYHFDDILDPECLVEDNHRKIDQNSDDFSILKNSILNSGVHEPIHISFNPENGQIRVIAGHRRRLAVIAIRAQQVPVKLPALLTVAAKNDEAGAIKSSIAGVVTNLVRQDLKGAERARAIKKFMAETGMTIADCANTIGVDRKTIERILNIAMLPEAAQALIDDQADKIKEGQLLKMAADWKAMIKKSGESLSQETLNNSALEMVRGLLEPKTDRASKRALYKVDLEALGARLRDEKLPPGAIEKVLAVIQAGV
jgi:ParB/RepB/Spo0J family partition protein